MHIFPNPVTYSGHILVVIITILNGCYKLEEGVKYILKLAIITHSGGQINPWKLCKQTCV